jgi:hypothetical protein
MRDDDRRCSASTPRQRGLGPGPVDRHQSRGVVLDGGEPAAQQLERLSRLRVAVGSRQGERLLERCVEPRDLALELLPLVGLPRQRREWAVFPRRGREVGTGGGDLPLDVRHLERASLEDVGVHQHPRAIDVAVHPRHELDAREHVVHERLTLLAARPELAQTQSLVGGEQRGNHDERREEERERSSAMQGSLGHGAAGARGPELVIP